MNGQMDGEMDEQMDGEVKRESRLSKEPAYYSCEFKGNSQGEEPST